MPDPLAALREPDRPIEPDPLFAAHLRARIARALALPKGVTVSDLDLDRTIDSEPEIESEIEPDAVAAAHRQARSGDVAYVSLWVPDADRAADFFGDVLGWTVGPGGGDGSDRARQVLGQSLPHDIYGGQDRSTLFLCFLTDDVTAAVERVRGAGGEADEPTDEPYGRTANCVDDQGVRFALVELPPDGDRTPGVAINGERHGDVSYLTMEVEDSARTRAFYGSVLGWQWTPGRIDDGWGVVDTAPMTGMHGGNPRATTLPMYRVDDIHAVVARLRARGGTSTDPEQQSYGLSAECVDDQGTRFYLGQH